VIVVGSWPARKSIAKVSSGAKLHKIIESRRLKSYREAYRHAIENLTGRPPNLTPRRPRCCRPTRVRPHRPLPPIRLPHDVRSRPSWISSVPQQVIISSTALLCSTAPQRTAAPWTTNLFRGGHNRPRGHLGGCGLSLVDPPPCAAAAVAALGPPPFVVSPALERQVRGSVPAPWTAASRLANARSAACMDAPSPAPCPNTTSHSHPARGCHHARLHRSRLVSHSGNWGDGEFLQSLNLTDIHHRGPSPRPVPPLLRCGRAKPNR
jgi:hypothetical protein